MKKIKILAIVGSLRKESYNRQLALAAKEILGDRVDFTLLEYQDIPLMNQDIEYPAPEAVKRVREEVKSADGIWFFTPEYNHFFPGVLKNLVVGCPPDHDKEPRFYRKPAAWWNLRRLNCISGSFSYATFLTDAECAAATIPNAMPT